MTQQLIFHCRKTEDDHLLSLHIVFWTWGLGSLSLVGYICLLFTSPGHIYHTSHFRRQGFYTMSHRVDDSYGVSVHTGPGLRGYEGDDTKSNKGLAFERALDGRLLWEVFFLLGHTFAVYSWVWLSTGPASLYALTYFFDGQGLLRPLHLYSFSTCISTSSPTSGYARTLYYMTSSNRQLGESEANSDANTDKTDQSTKRHGTTRHSIDARRMLSARSRVVGPVQDFPRQFCLCFRVFLFLAPTNSQSQDFKTWRAG